MALDPFEVLYLHTKNGMGLVLSTKESLFQRETVLSYQSFFQAYPIYCVPH